MYHICPWPGLACTRTFCAVQSCHPVCACVPALPCPPGVLSAVGIHLADIVSEAQEPCACVLGAPGAAQVTLEGLDRLEAQARARLLEQVGGGGGERC